MKRVIVDYKKLDKGILNLLVTKFPDGYSDHDIVSFKNHHNDTIEAVEIRTNDTIYLVKISERLAGVMQDFEDIAPDTNISSTAIGNDMGLNIRF